MQRIVHVSAGSYTLDMLCDSMSCRSIHQPCDCTVRLLALGMPSTVLGNKHIPLKVENSKSHQQLVSCKQTTLHSNKQAILASRSSQQQCHAHDVHTGMLPSNHDSPSVHRIRRATPRSLLLPLAKIQTQILRTDRVPARGPLHSGLAARHASWIHQLILQPISSARNAVLPAGRQKCVFCNSTSVLLPLPPLPRPYMLHGMQKTATTPTNMPALGNTITLAHKQKHLHHVKAA